MAQNQFINVGIDQGAAKKTDLRDHRHAVTNGASAKVAEASGFPDTGWWIIGLPVAS